MWIFAFQINLGAKMGIFRCRDCPGQWYMPQSVLLSLKSFPRHLG